MHIFLKYEYWDIMTLIILQLKRCTLIMNLLYLKTCVLVFSVDAVWYAGD